MPAISSIAKQCFVISLASATKRRRSVEKLLEDMDIDHQIEDAVETKPYYIGCAQSHLNVLEQITELPAMVLEDDVACFEGVDAIPDIPDDADIVYLSSSVFGCVQEEDKPRMDFALASATPHPDWLKLHTMTSTLAILYVSKKGVRLWKNAAKRALRRRTPIDIHSAKMMGELNVYLPMQRVFYEDPNLQGEFKYVTREQRLSFTKNPLPIREVGDQVEYEIPTQTITSEVVRRGDDVLGWEDIQSESIE